MSRLSAPLSLAHGTLSNRLAKSAMSERLALPDGRVSAELVRLYERWAKSGAGMLITGNVMVDARALGESGNVVIEDERDLDGLRAWAEAARSGGARVILQLNHPGRQAPRTVTEVPVAPSAVGLQGAGPLFRTPRALEPLEIEDIVRRFAETARVAEKAGFDGVQIHGAHGYLGRGEEPSPTLGRWLPVLRYLSRRTVTERVPREAHGAAEPIFSA